MDTRAYTRSGPGTPTGMQRGRGHYMLTQTQPHVQTDVIQQMYQTRHMLIQTQTHADAGTDTDTGTQQRAGELRIIAE